MVVLILGSTCISAGVFQLTKSNQWVDCCPTVEGIKLNVDYISKTYDESGRYNNMYKDGKYQVDNKNPFIREKLPRYMPLEVKNDYVKFQAIYTDSHALYYYKDIRSLTTKEFLEQNELLYKQ